MSALEHRPPDSGQPNGWDRVRDEVGRLLGGMSVPFWSHGEAASEVVGKLRTIDDDVLTDLDDMSELAQVPVQGLLRSADVRVR